MLLIVDPDRIHYVQNLLVSVKEISTEQPFAPRRFPYVTDKVLYN